MFLADSAESTSSWFVPALAGGFTLLGVLLGAVTSYFSDKRLYRREDAHRYDDDLRKYAATLINELISARDGMKFVSRPAKMLSEDEKLNRSVITAETNRTLRANLRNARMTLDELTIISPVGVRDSARSFYIYVDKLRKKPREELWDARFWELLNGFIAAVRLAVGLPQIEGPKGSWVDDYHHGRHPEE